MSLVDTTLCFPPPSKWHCSIQFATPTALRNGSEKMGIPGSGVFTLAISTASDLNHAQELTNQPMLGSLGTIGRRRIYLEGISISLQHRVGHK
jgi:hypothetical protein